MPSRIPRTRPPWRTLVVLSVAATLAGCYHGSARSTSPQDLDRDREWILVQGVRLIPQFGERDCGAAALAMMLEHWGTPSTPGEIWRAAGPEPGHGIAAGALRDFARRKGLRAYLIKGELEDLANEIRQNRPVLVGLVQHTGDRALAHYEVVAGINNRTREVLLMDPSRGLRRDSFDGFWVEWSEAGRPTLVIVPT